LVKILVVQSIDVLLEKFQDVTLDSCPTLISFTKIRRAVIETK